MPFTFAVAKHPAVSASLQSPGGPNASPTGDVLASGPTIIATGETVVTASNGFLSAVTSAYNRHHHLILRPDDVWLAILVQFGAYALSEAELLRQKFVNFPDKKTLEVRVGGTLRCANYALLTEMMGLEIAKNILDPSLRDWVVPAFSTTTNEDRVVGAAVLMATLQSYFDYRFMLMCGIPTVTLLGNPDDWREVESRAARLQEFDCGTGKMVKWYARLELVLGQLTRSAEGSPDVGFWQRVCDYHNGGSGPTFLSGWITVFAIFDKEGKWVGECSGWRGTRRRPGAPQETAAVDTEEWHCIDTSQLPSGVVAVPVEVDDGLKKYKTTLTAGHSAFSVSGHDNTAVQPRLQWALVLDGEVENETKK